MQGSGYIQEKIIVFLRKAGHLQQHGRNICCLDAERAPCEGRPLSQVCFTAVALTVSEAQQNTM